MRARTALVIAGSFWSVPALAAWPFDLTVGAVFFAVLCLAFYGVVSLIHIDEPLTWLIAIPLSLAAAGVFLFYSFVTSHAEDKVVAKYEQRLSPALVCRAYTYSDDSSPSERLILLKETRHLFRDAIVDTLVEQSSGCARCEMTRDGAVILRLHHCAGGEGISKRIPLANR